MVEDKTKCEICVDNCSINYYDENYELYIASYLGDIATAIKKYDYACLLYISNLAYILVQKGRLNELLKRTPEIIRADHGNLFTLLQISPIEAAGINKISANPILNLNGKGVIVAIIDTGIDYLNKEFQYEDSTTRILSIWDQTIQKGPPPEKFFYGAEYTRNDINDAIKLAENKGDPKTIVPTIDEIGHGTAMAGIIGARGVNKGFESVVNKCEFIIVKLKEASNNVIDYWFVERKNRHIFDEIDINLAIDYIMGKIDKIIKPVVVFIPLGANLGSRDGNGIIEKNMDYYSLQRGVVFVTGNGNEGISNTHASGRFEKKGDVKILEINIDKEQKKIVIEIWVKKPDKFSIAIISPSGETSGKLPAKIEANYPVNYVFEGSTGNVKFEIPEEYTGDEYIQVKLNKLVSGIWLIQLYGDYITDGRYDAWMSQRELIEKQTRFINSDILTTLTRPSDSRSVITCSYYNQTDNSIVAESGRGFTTDGRVKPDLACGGVNVITTSVTGGTTSVTGSSIASAVLAGAVAMLLQWGIVDVKDPTMYAPKVKNYLIRGTKKRSGDIYPNPQLGYGLLDMTLVFEQIRPSVRSEIGEKGIFINIPREIVVLINRQ